MACMCWSQDTDDSRDMLRFAPECCGARVSTAASAAEAKRVLETIRPHVMVSDISMPDDGVELVREVKTISKTLGLPISTIAITAYRDRREKLLAEGFTELVEKPLDPIRLCGIVRRYARLDT
jgi:CheY-like chemotaxis protein